MYRREIAEYNLANRATNSAIQNGLTAGEKERSGRVLARFYARVSIGNRGS
jgi:hypothetical protein